MLKIPLPTSIATGRPCRQLLRETAVIAASCAVIAAWGMPRRPASAPGRGE